MKLVRKVESKKDKSGHIRHYGIFLCPIDDKEVIILLNMVEKGQDYTEFGWV